jgi:hypothetical protein
MDIQSLLSVPVKELLDNAHAVKEKGPGSFARPPYLPVA